MEVTAIKLAYLFSGQGGKIEPLDQSLYLESSSFRETFDQAKSLLGVDLWNLWQSGDKRLAETRFAQPAIFVLSTALYRVIKDKLPQASALVGLSLGEYSALVAGDALDFSEGLKLIEKRGQLMQQASEEFPGAMAAVMSQDTKLIEDVCQDVSQSSGQKVQIANYNYPKQTVIGGQVDAVKTAVEALHQAGVQRIVDLPVSGAFHTPLMESANRQFLPDLEKIQFKDPIIPVVSNTTGKVFTDSSIGETLSKQMISSTRFTDCLFELQDLGVDSVVELGPGHSLVSFAKKTLKLDGYYAVNDSASLKKALAALTA
ncbi:putative Malonyl CoA-acyl carrier protein transacylase (fabD) [Oenococcus oeni]|uniref:ACP S-malonyltransferase n=1 Tax=Oenococcus oeni TaxID=1247 RepID=UPI00107BF4CE|nr:ACP S-malonyltransferase [Oenococcus oeni]AVI94741.1 ACP S-malonyltransferase [Oenococcus oeni]SYV98812.1 putative Malonyl CoA-acyl carrier protein transacylase (fabD) [Oenococcus oeni]SYV99174.1 putative Malonyl CoA-acyl carrier protein transacylase (fabD) [Oenococcus oeni]SYW18054.1 putative Malonyl CoA-acyl carrier protein transacylase (fabD) [Oenococcus oeni]VDC15351.1 putative Malonyl CoA-acyl carrier protein transacylase (fabD) [Oenococcus oeni]